MHKFKNKYKKYLKDGLGVFLCIVGFNTVDAFLISGNGNNLQVIQTNQAKSANFQINAKLKPTATSSPFVVASVNPSIPPSVVPTTPTTPPTTNTGGGSDNSSPYLGTADWSKQGRSQKATERRITEALKNEKEQLHPSSPKKEIIENLIAQVVDKSEISRDSAGETENIEKYNPQKDKLIMINDSRVGSNPAKFSLQFLEATFVKIEKEATCQCQNIYIHDVSDYWYPIAKKLFLTAICLTGIFFCLMVLVYLMWRKSREKKKKATKKSFWQKFKTLFTLFLILTVTSNYASAGPITTPQELIYEGNLLDNAGSPLTGNYSFRFSLWDNEDFEASDVISGNINVGAADYFGWQEVQAESLANGEFSLRLGNIEPFFAGLFNRTAMYLQVEVKNSADPDTSYELIDLDITNTTIDRTVIDTIPFAFNADRLDFRDSGYGPGEIPFIDPITGKLPASIIEAAAAALVGGVEGNIFTLDINGDATAVDNLVLKFGDILNKTLAWNGINDRFEFNDDVNIAGNLVVSGTINGQSFGPKNKIEVLSPRYSNSIIDSDGTDNSGSMYEEAVIISAKNKNILKWNTGQTDIQDYDVIIRYPLPANFAGFQVTPISLEFMTEGVFTDAKIDFVIEKEGSVVDELSGAGVGFNSNTWTTVDLNLNPATIWNPNDVMVIKLKMYSRNNLQSYISDIGLKYIES